MTDVWWLRLLMVVAGIGLILAIYFFSSRRGTPRAASGRRNGAPRVPPSGGGDPFAAQTDDDARPPEQPELGLHGEGQTDGARPGQRDDGHFDRIVTLYVAARSGRVLQGPDIVVAAEKIGLRYGHLDIFHRLLDTRPDAPPVFSMANIVKPGSFDLNGIQQLQTPAVALFLTLPAPVAALDAWEMLLPAAQRLAELLDGVLLDEDRSALGRQRIQHLREELRAYDRQREAPPITRSPRW
jgi:cell division protein ZipA